MDSLCSIIINIISQNGCENMNDSNRLGQNIRALRTAYGETQLQLGEAIHVAPNTVSSYETGRTNPDLTVIANHYGVSVDELLQSDFTSIREITVDKDAFWRNIGIIFPIVSSDRAMQNESFKRSFEAHKTFYGQSYRCNLDMIYNIDVWYDGYMTAMKDDEIKVEAAANFIALRYLMMTLLKMSLTVVKNQPAALWQIDEKAREAIQNPDPSFETDAKAILSEFNDAETEKEILEMLTTIKRSKEWSDLADYYLALRYIWNLVDNDLDWGFNQRIGVELMYAFKLVENTYADQFLKYSLDSIKGAGSQFVDDN